MSEQAILDEIESIIKSLPDVESRLRQADDCFRRGQHVTSITHAQQAEDMLAQLKNRIRYLFGLGEKDVLPPGL